MDWDEWWKIVDWDKMSAPQWKSVCCRASWVLEKRDRRVSVAEKHLGMHYITNTTRAPTSLGEQGGKYRRVKWTSLCGIVQELMEVWKTVQPVKCHAQRSRTVESTSSRKCVTSLKMFNIVAEFLISIQSPSHAVWFTGWIDQNLGLGPRLSASRSLSESLKVFRVYMRRP